MTEEHNRRDAGATGEGGAADDTAETTAGESAPSVETLQAELEAEREKARQNHERYLREAAELQNLHKRAREREEKARKFAVDRFATDLLNVKDSLEMGLAATATEAATVEALREGMQATLRQLEQAFEKAGLRQVDPAGEAFDPAQHEAMGMQELPELTREEVVTVVQKGYLLHERVLRPARVIVGRPAPRPAEGADGAASDGPTPSGGEGTA